VGGIETGYDDGGVGPHPTLQDLDGAFVDSGIEIGMLMWNRTTNASGAITAVTPTTVTVSGVTWSNGDQWWIVPLTPQERATIEELLDRTANDIHVALAAVGACNCNLASWAIDYLGKLNIVEAAAFHTCACARPNLSDEARKNLLDWANQQLELIRTMKLELCDGYTGADYPVIGWGTMAGTEATAAEIIANALEASGDYV